MERTADDILLCAPGDDNLLREEVGSEASLGPGIHRARFERDAPVFALQLLPRCRVLSVGSIREAAEAIGAIIAAGAESGATALHVFGGRTAEDTPLLARRALLLEKAVEEWLKRRRRSFLRARVVGRLAKDTRLVQVLVPTPETVIVSSVLVSRAMERCCLPAPAAAGRVAVSDDHRPPSRAYRKLLEAEQLFARPIEKGESCVELGASPGGWTFVAVERGARVTAVDRTPLRADLLRRVSFVRGDAFRFEPDGPVDWLLCDVAAAPERVLELLDVWLAEKRCRQFMVTFKFKGRPSLEFLHDARAQLAGRCRRLLLRRLVNNKNEVTACGSL